MDNHNVSTLKKLFFVLHHIHRKKLVMMGGCLIIVAFLDTVSIGMTVPLVASLISPHRLPFAKLQWLYAFNFFHVGSLRTWLCVLFPCLFLFKSGLTLLTQKLMNKYLFALRTTLTMKLISSYLQMPYSLFLDKGSAKILFNTVHYVGVFTQTFLLQVLTLVAECTVLCCMIAMLLLFNPVMTLVIIGILTLVLVGYTVFFRKKLYDHGVQFGESADQMNKWISQTFQGFKEVRVFFKQHFFYSQIEHWAEKVETRGAQALYLQSFPRLLFEMVFACGLSTFCLVMILLHWSAAKIIVTLTLFGASIFRILPAFNRMTHAISQIKHHQISLEMVHQELGVVSEVSKIPPKSLDPFSFHRDIAIQNLSFQYSHAGKKGIQGVSLVLKKGQKIGIVGKSGAGKTTLVDVLLGILPSEQGQVFLDGREVSTQDSRWLGLIGYVPQQVMLLNDTISRNVAFGVPDHEIDLKKVQKAIQKAQLEELINSYPEGIDTYIGEQGIKLSGGQRQRLGIARAMYHEPEVLIFDEATSSLDIETESLISKSILEIGSDKTCIIIAHRLSTVMACDVLHMMEEGRLVASGNFETLQAQFDWLRDPTR